MGDNFWTEKLKQVKKRQPFEFLIAEPTYNVYLFWYILELGKLTDKLETNMKCTDYLSDINIKQIKKNAEEDIHFIDNNVEAEHCFFQSLGYGSILDFEEK